MGQGVKRRKVSNRVASFDSD